MSPISVSKARRLRDAATKRKMYAARSSNQQHEPAVANTSMLQDIQSSLYEVKQFTMAVHSLLAFNSGLLGFPWSTGEIMEQQFLNPDAASFQPGQHEKSFEQRVTSPGNDLDCDPEALKVAATKIQRWYRNARAHTSTCKPADPSVTESNSCSAQSYRNMFCCLCKEDFHLDIVEADACDLCLEPYHTKCLHTVDHPVEPFSVCAACTPEAQSRASAVPDGKDVKSIHPDSNILPAVVETPLESAPRNDITSASSTSHADEVTDAAANQAWPDFNAAQASDFQHWYSDKLDAKRKVAVKSIQWLTEEAEKAEARGDIAAARLSLAKAGDIHKTAENPFDSEDMRRESWVFSREQEGF